MRLAHTEARRSRRWTLTARSIIVFARSAPPRERVFACLGRETTRVFEFEINGVSPLLTR
jgi:hypothetical protein